MPTAVEFDPEKGEIPPGPGIAPTGQMGDGSVRQGMGDGSVRWGLLLPAVLVLIIVVAFLFLPGQTLLSFFGCPGGLNGGTRNAVNGDGHTINWGDNALITLLDVLRGGLGQPLIGPMMTECSKGSAGVPGPATAVPDTLNVQPGPTPTCQPYAVYVASGGKLPFPICDPPPTSLFSGGKKPNVVPLPTATGVGECVVKPGDGICSACENSDLDSADCTCNMNGVCDPHEGFNCPDCQPSAVPGGDKPGGKSGGKKATACPPTIACP